MYLPGVPCHIIQRVNNRDATFFSEQDYRFYLECLYDASRKYQVEVHAYILMTNHVHLLMTPRSKESLSLVMQSIGRRYVQYVNAAAMQQERTFNHFIQIPNTQPKLEVEVFIK